MPYDANRDPPVPDSFIEICDGNLAEAENRWAATLDWRRLNNVDSILSEPQLHFHKVKALYPHFIHGRSKKGNLVFYEQPGSADINTLLTELGMQGLLRHYIFVSEWIFQNIKPHETEKYICVWDLTGLSFYDIFGGDTLRVTTEIMKVTAAHYPDNSDKMFIINAPSWFTTLWRIISPFVNASTRRKLSIYGSNYISELEAYIAIDAIPQSLRGTSTTQPGMSEEETLLSNHVKHIVNGAAPCEMVPPAAVEISTPELKIAPKKCQRWNVRGLKCTIHYIPRLFLCRKRTKTEIDGNDCSKGGEPSVSEREIIPLSQSQVSDREAINNSPLLSHHAPDIEDKRENTLSMDKLDETCEMNQSKEVSNIPHENSIESEYADNDNCHVQHNGSEMPFQPRMLLCL